MLHKIPIICRLHPPPRYWDLTEINFCPELIDLLAGFSAKAGIYGEKLKLIVVEKKSLNRALDS